MYVFKDYSGYGFYKPNEDPVFDAVEAVTWEERYNILAKLREDYPQFIDALVHIGNMHLDGTYGLQNALNCYRSAVYIAEKNLLLRICPEDNLGVRFIIKPIAGLGSL